MKLSDLRPAKGSRKKRFKVGRGPGSGKGKTAGRGGKGQTARKSGPVGVNFEGGQTPLQRRVPKRGFNSHFPQDLQVVNIGDLDAKCSGNVTIADMVKAGLVKSAKHPVKVLSKGKITKALKVSANKFSAAAVVAIQAAGGSVEVV